MISEGEGQGREMEGGVEKAEVEHGFKTAVVNGTIIERGGD